MTEIAIGNEYEYKICRAPGFDVAKTPDLAAALAADGGGWDVHCAFDEGQSTVLILSRPRTTPKMTTERPARQPKA